MDYSFDELHKAPIFAIKRHCIIENNTEITTMVYFMGCELNCKCCFATWMMYEPRGENDTTTHEFPTSCIVIIIEKDTIDIPFDDFILSTDLNENDSIRISYNVYRDKVGWLYGKTFSV